MNPSAASTGGHSAGRAPGFSTRRLRWAAPLPSILPLDGMGTGGRRAERPHRARLRRSSWRKNTGLPIGITLSSSSAPSPHPEVRFCARVRADDGSAYLDRHHQLHQHRLACNRRLAHPTRDEARICGAMYLWCGVIIHLPLLQKNIQGRLLRFVDAGAGVGCFEIQGMLPRQTAPRTPTPYLRRRVHPFDLSRGNSGNANANGGKLREQREQREQNPDIPSG
ncbi:hypothetical protein B0H16DRAFT_968035 [Mycena metata]|uniref:Uncharacterized protein n=1 Tax=Mycena metata TaxID=1033252 RepID=A0AAD7ILU1_9AGAR|nr:hypothetical protein B0H16DRAFT_968035 [Mycena metata]